MRFGTNVFKKGINASKSLKLTIIPRYSTDIRRDREIRTRARI
jgi:hypothetical protein